MSSDDKSIDTLKLKIKSVTRCKLSKESEVLKLRNLERSLSEEHNTIINEISFLVDELETLKQQLQRIKQEILMIDICGSSEDVKIAAHKDLLNVHYEGYQKLFEKEQKDIENRIKEQKEKEVKLLEQVQQKQMQKAEENEKQAKDIVAIEEDCEIIERECCVLKKRNRAILLKLRKKLVETEELRRQRAKHNSN